MWCGVRKEVSDILLISINNVGKKDREALAPIEEKRVKKIRIVEIKDKFYLLSFIFEQL